METEKDPPCRAPGDSGHPLLRVRLSSLTWNCSASGEEGVETLTNLESPNLGRSGNSLPWPLVFMFLVGWWALGAVGGAFQRARRRPPADC